MRAIVLALVLGLAASEPAAAPAISGGSSQGLALKADGTVWHTGSSGTCTRSSGGCNHTSLERLPDLAGVIAIAAANHADLFLKENGTVWSMGFNLDGVLGGGADMSASHSSSRQVVGLTQIAQIDCQGAHCLALRSDGFVWAWGSNGYGQVDGTSEFFRSTPVRVNGPSSVVAISAGGTFRSMALAADGTVWIWGLFHDTRLSMQKIAGLSGVKALAGSSGANLFLKTDGTVWTQGYGGAIVQVAGVLDIVAIAAQESQHFALRRDGTVWGWGINSSGVIGSGDFTRTVYDTPTRVQGLANTVVIAISAGARSSYALAADGAAYAWGANDLGQLGDNTLTDRAAAVRMAGPGGVGSFNALAAQPVTNQAPNAGFVASPDRGSAPLTVTAESKFVFDFDADGTIARLEWFVSDGQRATGPTATFVFPQAGSFTISLLVTDNLGGSSFATQDIVVNSSAGPIQTKVAITGGYTAAAAIRADGKAFSWGTNFHLGRGLRPGGPGNGPFQTTLAGPIDNIAGVTSIAMGLDGGLVAMADGSVAAWGRNTFGEVGDGTNIWRFSPVPVQGIPGVIAVAAGEHHRLALKSDGTVWSWGGNTTGQLGTGTAADSRTPVQVRDLTNVKAIAAGQGSSLALKGDGTVWAWGANESGQLGVAAGTGRSIAAPISGLARINRIWCGWQYCFAADLDGVVWGWGANYLGQLGLGTQNSPQLPVPIPAFRGFIEFAAGVEYTIALRPDGSVWRSGQQRRPGTTGDPVQSAWLPAAVPGIRNAIAIGVTVPGGGAFAVNSDGTVLAWGKNTEGEVGDGTLAARASPVSMSNETLDGLFDLIPDVPNVASLSRPSPFFSQAASTGALTDPTLTVTNLTRFNAVDVGKTGSVFVFAFAPASLVKASSEKADPVQCVLAQLNASGQLQAVSASSLQAYVTGVLSAQGQAVTVLNGVPTATIGGATFFVGYGSNATSMLTSGTNRGVVSVPGATGAVACQPQPPLTGWWWNTAEGGRGYSIEVAGNHLFFASYLYDVTGRATWLVAAGNTTLDGSLFIGNLENYAQGQTLTGAYKPPTAGNSGAITLAFNDESHGTMIWPGGTVAIERFNIVPNGLNLPAQTSQPQSGWWWNPTESGRGYFLEWQGGQLFMAGYMYDDAGNPIWYLSGNSAPSANLQGYSNSWQLYGNGQTLTGAYKPPTAINPNVGPVTIQFSGAETGIMTLPGGRTTAITRFRF